MFPPMAHIIDLFGRKHFKKNVLRIGSWGWVGGAKKEYETAVSLTGIACRRMSGKATWHKTDLLELEKLGEKLAKVYNLISHKINEKPLMPVKILGRMRYLYKLKKGPKLPTRYQSILINAFHQNFDGANKHDFS